MRRRGIQERSFRRPIHSKTCRQTRLEGPIPLKEDTRIPLGNNSTNYEMTTNIRISVLLGIGVTLIVAGVVLALSKDDIVYPVAELGNCQNEQECRAYCDDSENIAQCVAFAE